MKSDHTSPRVTVEDLLRLKRAERPDAQFWHQFERDMRVKQLAAIVEPRRWWTPFIRVGSRLARYQLPVGATAILALTFLTVREYQLPEATDTQFIADTVVAAAAVDQSVDASVTPENSLINSVVAESAGAETTLVAQTPVAAPATEQPEAVQPESVYSPAAEAIAANLAAVKAKTPELARLIARVSGVDEIINPRTPARAVDPLARVSTNRRTSRLLANALPANYSSGRETRDSTSRLNRDLTEERVYDSISRIGVKADRLAISF